MNRRQLLATGAICALGLTGARAASADSASFVDYSRPDFDAALASGKPVLLAFLSDW